MTTPDAGREPSPTAKAPPRGEPQPGEAAGLRHWERLFGERTARVTEPGWLATRRAEAFAAFAAAGFPRPKAPGWRHTNIAPIGRIAFEIDGPSGPDAALDLPHVEGSVRFVFVDGRLREDLSSTTSVAGLSVTSLARELSAGSADVREALRTDSASNGPFAALNLALADDGAVVRVAPKAASRVPVHLVFATTRAGATASHVRTLVIAGALSEVTVIEHYVGPSDDEYLVNAVTDVIALPGSRVTHARVQEEGAGAWHVADVRARLDRDAHLLSLSVALGGKLSRTGLHAVLDGEGAECDLLGLYLGRDRQHQDHTTVVDHDKPHGTSRERYKGILDGASRGVFAGLVRVAEGAVKTDASQDNRNLILSDKAHADSEPMLEIHTDDLKASHASAIGRLDDDALFYLRARGIDAPAARRMLTRAFAADVLDGVPDALKVLVEGRVAAWLAETAQGGEP